MSGTESANGPPDDPLAAGGEAEVKLPVRLSIGARLRNYFLAGILITAPISLTVYIAWLIISWVDEKVLPLVPPEYNPENYLPFSIPGIGLVIIVVVLTVTGAVTAGLLGRWTRQVIETVLNRVPIVRSLYGAIKQVMETVLANKSVAFRECVLVEFPRTGIWTIGFVSGVTPREVQERTGGSLVNVFVPTTPNPTSGYLIFVPRSELVYLKMSVEDGIKLVVSGGIVAPGLPKVIKQPKLPLGG